MNIMGKCLHCNKITHVTIFRELVGFGEKNYLLCKKCYNKERYNECSILVIASVVFLFVFLGCSLLSNVRINCE